jgi:transposase
MLGEKEICLGMEATGNYGYALAEHMYNLGYTVYVMNPALIKYYGKSLHYRVKTDKQDAKLIHAFMLSNKDRLHTWKPLSQSHQDLRALNRCLENLKEEIVKFSNMAKSELSSKARNVYKSILKKLEKKAESVATEIRNVVDNDQDLKGTVSLLLTIPSVGEITAWNLLSELPDLKDFKNAKQLAAYAGLNPSIRQSGTSVHSRGSVSKVGSARLRKSLYFPAMSALRYNPCVKVLGDRLKVKGKNGKVIVVAAMHKLLRMIFAVLKKGEAFNFTENKV